MVASPICRQPVCQAVRHGRGLRSLDAVNPACRSPLGHAFRSLGAISTGAVRVAPRRRAFATSYEPRTSGNGHTAPGVNPLLHAAQPAAAAAYDSSQGPMPLGVHPAPTSGDIILHNAPPEQFKADSSSVTAADASREEPSSGGAVADDKPPVNPWVLFVQEQYVAEMDRLPAGQHDRKSVMGALSKTWKRSSELRAKYGMRHRELQRAYKQRHQVAEPEPAPKKQKQRRAAGPSAAEERLEEVLAQVREVQAGYRRLGDDVAFQQEQLWHQAGVLRAAVNEDVTYRLQQLTAENGRLWLFAITQHQNAFAAAQALQVMQLQQEVRSLRALVAASEEAQRPRGGARLVIAAVTAVASVLFIALGVTAIFSGASSALKAGVAAGRQLQQPYAAPVVLIIGAVLVAAAIAQDCVAAFAALKADV